MDPMGIGQKRRCKGLPPRKATRFLVVNLIFLTAMNENLGPTKMGLKGRMAGALLCTSVEVLRIVLGMFIYIYLESPLAFFNCLFGIPLIF